MDGTQNFNIDSRTLSQCLKTVSNFGSTTYKNICTGEATTVDWGNLEYVSAIGLFLIVVGGLAMIGFLFYKMIIDY